MLDLRGTTIEPGDEFAYAQRDGNSARMRLYHVLEILHAHWLDGTDAVKALPIDSLTTRATVLANACENGVVVKKATQ